MKNLHLMRREYNNDTLHQRDMKKNPIEMYTQWLNEAIEAGIDEPNAMVLATATTEGKPSARVVLLKEVTDEGFIFFTNYQSRKGKELLASPQAALVFDWHPMGRQVRIEGKAEQIPEAQSDEYYQIRPQNARIGAWASPQSSVVSSRKELDEMWLKIERQFTQDALPRPSHWGGFIVRPEQMEFWQGQPSRMHDRLVYTKTDEGWKLHRLAP